MADVKIPFSDNYGRASFEQMDTYLQSNLLSGVEPALVPAINLKQKVSTTLAQFSVVGYDSNGDVVLLTQTLVAAGLKGIGVVPHASVAPGTGTTLVPVWYSGCFDPDSLVWDASLNTDALRAAAFVGSPTPTQVVIKKRFA